MPKRSPVSARESSSKADERDARAPVSGAAVESVPRKTRRSFSASEKLRLVGAAEAVVASGEAANFATTLWMSD